MPNKSSNNRWSILVAVITAVLILSGVYFLNQMMAGRNQEDGDTLVRSSSASKTSSSESSPDSDSPFEDTLSSESSTIPEDSISSDQTSSDSSETSSSDISSESSSESSSSDSDSNSSSSGNLQQGQISVRVVSVGTPVEEGGPIPYKFEVIDSTFPDAKFFSKGSSPKLSLFGVNVTQGNSYVMSVDFTETESSFLVNSIQVISQI